MAGIRHFLAVAVLLFGACGDGNGTGSGVSLPGAGGSGGGGTSPGGTSGCSCLATVVGAMENCQPSGTCVEQLVGTTAVNVCYSNGVKLQVSTSSVATDAMSMTMTAKKGSVCYSVVMNQVSADNMSAIFKNAAGATIATLGTNADGQETVTCPGGASVVMADACDPQLSSAGTATNPPTTDCTQGTCTF